MIRPTYIHRNLRGDLAHDREIMGDRRVGRPELGLPAFEEVEDLGPDETSSPLTASSSTIGFGPDGQGSRDLPPAAAVRR